MKDLNLKLKTIKYSEKYAGNISWHWIWQFLRFTTKAMTIKKIDNLNFIKIKKLFCVQGHYQQNEKQSMKWKKIFGDHISDKNLIFRIIFKNSCNSITTTKSKNKNGQSTLIYISLKKVSKWPINTWKDA